MSTVVTLKAPSGSGRRRAFDPTEKSQIDCVLVGFNEVNFHDFARIQKQFEMSSGAYSELKTNSVRVGDQRRTYMELLNDVLERATGEPYDLNPFEMPSLGVAYLASYLRRRNLRTEIVNFYNKEKARFAELLKARPRSVAITTTYYVSDEPIRELVDFIRSINPELKIIIGGPRIFNICMSKTERMQDLVFRSLGADIYIRDSQGEDTLYRVVDVLAADRQAPDLGVIPNLIYRSIGPDSGRGRMTRTVREVESNDLSANHVDWSYFDPSFFTPTTYMRTSRSCSFKCAFCNYPAMAGPLTLADNETIRNELRYLNDCGVENIIFVDDTFNVPLPRFKKLLRSMIEDKLNISWVSFFRCSNCDDETFDLMAEAKCMGVFLGIESGDPTILKNMNKFAKVERYRYGIARLREREILTLASLVLGFPGETGETVKNTLELVNTARPDFYNVQLYFHDVLAPIEQKREEYGISGEGYTWSHASMSWQQAAQWKDYFIERVDGPALMPLYGLSIWALPYLVSKGLSFGQIRSFAKQATQLLQRGLRDEFVDASEDIERMARIFA